MRPGLMTIENFMTIKDLQVHLGDKGLVLINGENLDDDAFDSNGSGKSAIFSEAPTWCLFGKTIRDLPADKVINRNVGRNTMVSLELVDEERGDSYEVFRHRSHSQHGNHVLLFHDGVNITGKSDKDTNLLIEEIIGMDYLTFTNSIMFGQGISKMFAQSTDAEQKSILEQMLQIGIFKQCLEKTKEKIEVIKSDLNGFDTDLKVSRNLMIGLNQQVEDLQAKEAELGEKVTQRIAELDQSRLSYHDAILNLPKSKDLLDELATSEKLLATTINKLDVFKKYEEDRSKISSLILSANKDVTNLDSFIKTCSKNLHDIRSGTNVPKTCEKCGQALALKDTSHIESHLEKDIADSTQAIGVCNTEIERLMGLHSKVIKKLGNKAVIEKSISDLRENITGIKYDIKARDTKEKSLVDSLGTIMNMIRDQEDLLSTTYTSLIEENIAKINATGNIAFDIEVCIDIKNEELAKYEFWISGFGNQGIKSVLLDSVTPFLNKKANYYLGKLTGSSIEVKFTTQVEAKSGKNKGEKKDKFSVSVTNKNGDDSYQGNSGGEKRRTDIAINMSLQDLVLSRSSKKLDFLVFDEAFEGLDGVGCENVIHLLYEKAMEFGSVYVITHNDELKKLFSKDMTVRKHHGETNIIY